MFVVYVAACLHQYQQKKVLMLIFAHSAIRSLQDNKNLLIPLDVLKNFNDVLPRNKLFTYDTYKRQWHFWCYCLLVFKREIKELC